MYPILTYWFKPRERLIEGLIKFVMTPKADHNNVKINLGTEMCHRIPFSISSDGYFCPSSR